MILAEIKTKIAGINRGGFSITNITHRDYYFHQNLIFFILENGILIEQTKVFKQICKNYFQIGLLRKKINNQGKIDLSRIELYSAIKYFTPSELRDFFYELCSKNTKIVTSEDNIAILINDIFTNCLTGYTASYNQNFIEYLCNELFLLEYFQLTTEHFKIIINKIDNIINSANNHLDFFKSINNFFAAQYNLCSQQSDFPVAEVFNIIITLLYKFANDKINSYEYYAIKNNFLYNIYYIALSCKLIFTNNDLLKILIVKIKKYEIKEKLKIISYVFVNLYNISNIECRDTISNYIKENKETVLNEQFDFDIMLYELLLAYNKLFEITNERICYYLNYMEKYKKDAYDSRIGDIFNLLETIKKNDKQLSSQTQFDELYDLVKVCTEAHKKMNQFHSVI